MRGFMREVHAMFRSDKGVPGGCIGHKLTSRLMRDCLTELGFSANKTAAVALRREYNDQPSWVRLTNSACWDGLWSHPVMWSLTLTE